jgi:hypothetical protein
MINRMNIIHRTKNQYDAFFGIRRNFGIQKFLTRKRLYISIELSQIICFSVSEPGNSLLSLGRVFSDQHARYIPQVEYVFTPFVVSIFPI